MQHAFGCVSFDAVPSSPGVWRCPCRGVSSASYLWRAICRIAWKRLQPTEHDQLRKGIYDFHSHRPRDNHRRTRPATATVANLPNAHLEGQHSLPQRQRLLPVNESRASSSRSLAVSRPQFLRAIPYLALPKVPLKRMNRMTVTTLSKTTSVDRYRQPRW